MTRVPLDRPSPRKGSRATRLARGLRRFTARPRATQLAFPFVERSRRLARQFKLSIGIMTVALLALILTVSANGRYLAGWTLTRARWAAIHALGMTPGREDIDADWRRRRRHDIDQTRGKLTQVYGQYSPPMRRLLDLAGLDPEHALLRWGNFDKTLYLPSTVFEADETGRSYRFRPKLRSIWVRNLKLQGGILAYFPVPNTPELDAAAKAAGALVVASSVQTTNSWGLRGPEPDTTAPLRGIVLGDSYMQGLFVGDEETPSECLKRSLSALTGRRTEILNTGHLGYSPEQEYFTLREYGARFRPQFVVLSLFANDFGDLFEVLDGKGDYDETRHWIGEIFQYCRTQGLECLVVPAPWVNQLSGPRRSGFYPGLVANILDTGGTRYLDPIEDFADELLRQQIRLTREGKPTSPDPLFNGHLADGHFSPLGCRVWARAVAERLALLLEQKEVVAATRR